MIPSLANTIKEHADKIEAWLSQKEKEVRPDPIYASVDIRNAGYKVAPVDTNIFPAGFNNLCKSYRAKASKILSDYFKQQFPNAKKVLLYPEDHTKNTFYLENVFILSQIIKNAGLEVRIGSINPELADKGIEFETSEGNKIKIYRAHESNGKLAVQNFAPDAIVINNDFSALLPEVFNKIKQPLLPSPFCGWHTRSKSDHFKYYCQLATEFAELIDIDPWLLCAEFELVKDVNLKDKATLDKLAEATKRILEKTQNKFEEHGIKEKPYVFIKNDAGTYGMAVMKIELADEIYGLNKKQRTTMKMGKGHQEVTDVIVQEGLITTDRIDDTVAEPVMYVVDHQPIGGFFRLHEDKDDRSSLNTPGMKFTKMCFHDMKGYSNAKLAEYPLECLRVVYETISRLASIAAGYESKETTQNIGNS